MPRESVVRKLLAFSGGSAHSCCGRLNATRAYANNVFLTQSTRWDLNNFAIVASDQSTKHKADEQTTRGRAWPISFGLQIHNAIDTERDFRNIKLSIGTKSSRLFLCDLTTDDRLLYVLWSHFRQLVCVECANTIHILKIVLERHNIQHTGNIYSPTPMCTWSVGANALCLFWQIILLIQTFACTSARAWCVFRGPFAGFFATLRRARLERFCLMYN